MRPWRRLKTRLPDERGFTLIELLVVIVAGAVVMMGLFTMVDVTLHSTTRVFTTVDATQRAQTTLESIMNDLHSACFTAGAKPIQPQSSDTRLLVESPASPLLPTQNLNAAAITPNLHEIVYDPTAKTLVENTYQGSGNSPNWTFSSTSFAHRTLLTNVISLQFQYFDYEQLTYTDSAGNPYMMILDGTNAVPGTTIVPAAQPLPTPLSTDDAASAVEVKINAFIGPAPDLTTKPTNLNPNLQSAGARVTASAVLRLSPAANHAGNGHTFKPCE